MFRHAVAPKIVPSHLKGKQWMSDEIKKIEDVYKKYDERFEVFLLSRGFTGEEISKQECIDMIKSLFYSREHQGGK